MQAIKDLFRRYSRNLFFIPLPIILLVISQWNVSIRGSYFERDNYDPEYQYLLNGLLILNKLPPKHVDHPGTTLQLIIAATVKISHKVLTIIHQPSPINLDVLQNPETYLRVVRSALVLGIAILLFLIAILIYKKTKYIWAAIGFQIFPFLSTSVMFATARVTPEPLLIITVLLITILLVISSENNQSKNLLWQPILLGLFLGFGLVTKLTFLPFLLLVFWFPRWRDILLTSIASVVSFLIFTIPVWSRADYFIKWVENLITKQQLYGSGEQGIFPHFQSILLNLVALIKGEPVYFIFLIFLVIYCVLIWNKRAKENKQVRIRALLLVGVMLLELIMAMKYSFPRYMVPGLTLMGYILFLLILKTHSISFVNIPRMKMLKIASIFFILGLFFINAFIFLSASKTSMDAHLETQNIDSLIKNEYAGCTVIPYYGGSSQPYAMLFANNNWAMHSFSDTLEILYPDFIAYNVWGHDFDSFGGLISNEAIENRLSQGDCILLRGRLESPSPSATEANLYAQLNLQDIFTGNFERIYLLTAIFPATP